MDRFRRARLSTTFALRLNSGPDTFDQLSDVLVAHNGDIFVADGHGAGGNNRIVKFNSAGDFIMEWGRTGSENGEFRDPHALAMDSCVVDGLVTSFIPDPDWHVYVRGTTGAEGVAADAFGNVYGAEVGPRMLRKYMRVR